MWGESPKEHGGRQPGIAHSEDTSVVTKRKATTFGDQADIAPEAFSEAFFFQESFDKQEDSNTIWVSCTLREKKHLKNGNGSVYQGG